MKQHLKSIIWPRGKLKTSKNGNVYRYVVVGMLVTDEPIKEFESKNEILLDGPINDIVNSLIMVDSRDPNYKVGSANSVLTELDLI